MKHLKKFNELYDSEESKKEISKDELKKMVSMDFDHAYSKYNYMGENPAELNRKTREYTYGDSHTKFDRYAILDEIYKKSIKIIPELKKFKFKEGHLKGQKAFVFNREIILNVPNLDDNYSIKINVWVDYNFKDDDIFDESKEGTINLLFYPDITTTRTSIGLEDIGGVKTTKKDDGSADIDDEEIGRVMFTLNKALYGAPDGEDDKLRRKFKISKKGISMDEFRKSMLEIKQKLKDFENYIYAKYGIKIL